MADMPAAINTVPRIHCRILGIDPGSRDTGFAILDSNGRDHHYITSGCIRIGAQAWPERLGTLFTHMSALIATHQPQELAIEQLIVARDPTAALKLGQARGAILCAAFTAGLMVREYSAKVVKNAVVGTGNADKQQVQRMVQLLLSLPTMPGSDEADALALAICHAHARHVPVMNRATSTWRDYRPPAARELP